MLSVEQLAHFNTYSGSNKSPSGKGDAIETNDHESRQSDADSKIIESFCLSYTLISSKGHAFLLSQDISNKPTVVNGFQIIINVRTFRIRDCIDYDRIYHWDSKRYEQVPPKSILGLLERVS